MQQKTKKQRCCLICREWFIPDPRACKQQKICSKSYCQKERKRKKWRRWAKRNKGLRNKKLCQWAYAYPHYWRHYRETHPFYRQKEMQRMNQKRKGLHRVAKQTYIRSLFIKRLQGIQTMGLKGQTVAKQTQISRQIQGILDCLIWVSNVAKQPIWQWPTLEVDNPSHATRTLG